ncbi:hypothetical protein YBT020_04825 [Bacillus thuringiensis serovar finitimus YBT-020]|nr:hypothetical protein YBT020_04825 [Bacillus thuringiensis serovar finitimus YBT-020]
MSFVLEWGKALGGPGAFFLFYVAIKLKRELLDTKCLLFKNKKC